MGAVGRGPARQQCGIRPMLLIPGSPAGSSAAGLAGGRPYSVPVLPPDPPSLERRLDRADLSHRSSDMIFVFRDGRSPSQSQQNTTSPLHFTSSSHHQHCSPFRIPHWTKLIMVISHLRRTKISISCNPAHVILNSVLPHTSFTSCF